jgi:hypothetical protein
VDVGLWFMEDARWANALIAAKNRGVKVRILMDTQANAQHDLNGPLMNQMAAAGIPMRNRTASGIEHWKMVLLAGQNIVYFGSANFSVNAWVPNQPYVDYVDETIYGTDDDSIVNSFKTKFDDAWVNTTDYANFWNFGSPVREYQPSTINPDLNFPPQQDFGSRSVGRYNAETQKIDVIIYRITDQRHTNAIINAKNRGVPVRMIVEPQQYRDVARLWHSWNVDRLYMAGIALRNTVHLGLNHQKSTLLYGQNMTIFGSSNWTSPSALSQHEHNYFTTKTFIFDWFVDQFERKWNNTNPVGSTETAPFTPLPPDNPVNNAPANGTVGQATSGIKLKWYGGPWAHLYDIYFGTSPNPPLFAADQALGPSQTTTQFQQFALPTLTAGTTYYWKIVGKTMALQQKQSPVWSFTTAGSPPPPPPSGATTIVLWTDSVPPGAIQGDWSAIADATAAGGGALHNPNRNRAKIVPALAAPANYFEISFDAIGGVPYHLWVRVRAQSNSTANDSIHIQFSDSTDSLGTPTMRMGTTSSAELVLQNGPSGGAPQNWGWTENGWGALGPHVYFETTGTHTLRVQQREDGPIVDQIVLSPDTYLTTPPGARLNDGTILPETGGGPPPPPPPPPSSEGTVVLWMQGVPGSALTGRWEQLTDSAAAGGSALWNRNMNNAKVAPALAGPANYFEVTFDADADTPYHVWVRLRAEGNATGNDSVHIQFSDSLNPSGSPFARIGTSSSAEFVLQDGPGGAAPSGWGWTENGWGALGPHIFFETTGTHTLRVQQREDGAIIDQIVISPDAYLTTAPGSRRNDGTILPETGGGPPPPPPSSEGTVVLWMQGVPGSALTGRWEQLTDSAAAGGSALWNRNMNNAKVAPALAGPANYFEVTFDADADTPYHVWVRMRAENNATANDSVHLQFSGSLNPSGSPFARIGTTSSAEFVLQDGPGGAAPSGWGWTDNGWGSLGPHIFFETTGAQTLLVQQREDGPVMDQIVISADAYLTTSPGSRRNDSTVLPAQNP